MFHLEPTPFSLNKIETYMSIYPAMSQHEYFLSIETPPETYIIRERDCLKMFESHPHKLTGEVKL